MNTFIKAKLKKLYDQTNFDHYRVAVNNRISYYIDISTIDHCKFYDDKAIISM